MPLSTGQSLIVEEYLGLASTTARRFARGQDYQELRSECLLALSRAVLTYVPGSSSSLRSYIIRCCRRACIDLLRRRKLPSEPIVADVTERLDGRHERNEERLTAIRRVSLSRSEVATLDAWAKGLPAESRAERYLRTLLAARLRREVA